MLAPGSNARQTIQRGHGAEPASARELSTGPRLSNIRRAVTSGISPTSVNRTGDSTERAPAQSRLMVTVAPERDSISAGMRAA
jgi:hypothetical protein